MKNYQFFSGFSLKIIAMLTMVIDHIGFYFFPSTSFLYFLFRGIGRLSFPLFSFLIVEGIHYSKKPIIYILKLLILGIIIDVFSVLILNIYESSVLISFALSASAMLIFEKGKKWFKLCGLFFVVIGILSGFSFFPLNLYYGPYGIILTLLFYLAKKISIFLIDRFYPQSEEAKKLSHKLFTMISASLFITFSIATSYLSYELNNFFNSSSMDYQFQTYSLISCIFILLYNGKRGYNKKWFQWGCYLFFPLHFIIIFLIGLVI